MHDVSGAAGPARATVLLSRLAAVFAQRRPAASPIYEAVREWDAETDSPTHPSPQQGVGGCVAMARVDSGHETLADDDSPTPTYDSDGGDLSTSLPEQHGGDLNTTLSEQHIYEEVAHRAARAPPKLPAISGVLQNAGPVIRPVAYRPTPTHTPSATPTRFGSVERINRTSHYGSALELKAAGPAGVDRRVNSNMARARYESLDSLRAAAGPPVLGRRAAGRVGAHGAAGVVSSTPSPSDSGVAGLEAILRERDSEINFLRETMEQNEQVIFSVYHEKEKTWEKELRKIKAIYDNRLKASQQRALKMEQMLTMQTYQLQQEKRKLRQETDELRRDKDQTARQNKELKQELTALRSQLEDTEWRLCQKTGEISLLKSQLKDCQGDQTTRSHEMLHIRAQVREYAAQLETKDADNKRLQAETQALREQAMDRRSDETNVVIGQLQREMERLKTELSIGRAQAQAQREGFEEERLHWLDEKQKVVNYQKQLQLNYMEMYKRNKSLELELSSRESKLNSSGESQC
ncbi:leucine zipper putative tumor suppressor 2-like [Pollicipes pollicipes]|uniref:leucine zipper putative tumor suppressor 2-like n=1 Tax=Pollicipes pollicipes TaxID=41117 RepID=UPI001884E386|nr:leucine zipper putative tumor suppressor 2-like [Pollicipes pollicipes]